MLIDPNKIRTPNHGVPQKQQITRTLLILLLGILMGLLSKFLDETPSNFLPFFLQALDLRNFFSRLAIWLFIGVWISVSASSAKPAALNVFVFFLGFVSIYYLYSTFIAGFFPQNYAMIWFGLAFVSPLLGYVCWFTNCNGLPALVLKIGIIAVMFSQTFAYGWLYLAVRSPLELLVFCATVWLLHRTIEETLLAAGFSVILAFLFKMFLPFGF